MSTRRCFRAMLRALLCGNLVLLAAVARSAPVSCEELAKVPLPQGTISLAQTTAADAFTPPAPDWAKAFMHPKPVPAAFCRVVGHLRPTADSDIKFEVWLPTSGWSGRYESVGNGGFAGFIRYDSMVNPLLAGSVVASTDDGHDAPAVGPTAADWALGHREKIIDYGYRAVHLTAVAAKAIATRFYGRAPAHSYFVGCSKGGQEGYMEAQRYPQDFDGIVSGAAANNWVRLFTSFVWNESINLAGEESYLTLDDLENIDGVIIKSCAKAGDAAHGFLSDPLHCHVNTHTLGLAPPKLRTYEAIHLGPSDRGGKSVFAGQPYGSELAWSGVVSTANFEAAKTDAQMSMYGGNFFRNFVYQDRKWSFKSLDLDKTLADARDIGEIMNATDASFKGFKVRGGKFIAFAGMADSIVTPLSSVHYYQSVVAAQGPSPASALASTQRFYRLFLAPGVGHCGGGPGPNEFGQAGGTGDAEHDLVVGLEHWVEQGVAPTRIIATKFSGDDPAKGIAMTRPLCPYPQVAKYSGSGDIAEAKNFACVD
jgi:Tannase and feruloyl esterase